MVSSRRLFFLRIELILVLVVQLNHLLSEKSLPGSFLKLDRLGCLAGNRGAGEGEGGADSRRSVDEEAWVQSALDVPGLPRRIGRKR